LRAISKNNTFKEENLMKRSFLVTFMLLLGASLFAQDKPGTENWSLDLFQDAETTPAMDRSADNIVLRSRNITVRHELFSDKSGPHTGRQETGAVTILNLFPDVYFTAVLERIEHNASGSTTWFGHLEEVEHGTATFVIGQDNVVVGNIVMPGAMYQIRYAGDGVHKVLEINEAAMPADAEPVVVDNGAREDEKAPPPLTRDNGSVIDVLVVYTPNARSAEGGTSAMNNLVDLAVAETNQSYSNSGVNFQLNLVYKGEVSYTESSNFSTNLSRLTSKTDGYIDNVHSLRDQYCADVVALIIEGSQYCGIANLMTTVSSSFEDRAFSVTARTCATGYYSFGHELGHNMAARHDWYVDSSTSPYIYNHGYVKVSNNWRTIMAYNSECSANGTSCTRLQYWSNPNVTYGGNPMGVGGSTTGSSAYNALALNNSASVVANWRDSTTSCGSTGGCSGDLYTGTLTGTGDEEFEPNGTYYYSGSSGTHTADLTGTGSDFDLYLWKWNGSAWSTVASSESSNSSESISYSGSAGYYVWRVYSYSGSGDYELCTTKP
jgi:hypothetical protein